MSKFGDNKFGSDQKNPIKIAVLSFVTSNRSDLKLDDKQSIEMVSYCLCDIQPDNTEVAGHRKTELVRNGNTFEKLIEDIKEVGYNFIYVDNLSFYYLYILNKLRLAGFDIVDNLRSGSSKTNKVTVFVAKGVCYYLKIKFNRSKAFTFMAAEQLLRTTCIKLQTVDYTKLNENNIEYCNNFVRSGCEQLRELVYSLFKEGLFVRHGHYVTPALTIQQLSRQKLVSSIDKNKPGSFNKMFPNLTMDQYNELRPGYRAGYVYTNPKYTYDSEENNEPLKDVIAYDCNKMYASMMYSNKFPWGKPMEVYDGSSVAMKHINILYSESYNGYHLDSDVLFICYAHIECTFNPGYLPWLDAHEVCENNMYKRVVCGDYILTSVELDMLFKQATFELDGHSFLVYKYWVFNSCSPFKNFVEKYFNECNALPDGPDKYIHKMILNTAYGGFARKPDQFKTTVDFDEDAVLIDEGVDKLEGLSDDDRTVEEENIQGGYLPMAMFISAYARKYIIEAANSNIEKLVHIDTDSLHLVGVHQPKAIEVGRGIGQFKIEHNEEEAYYFGPKTYTYKEVGSDHWELKASGLNHIGLPKYLDDKQVLYSVSFDNVVRRKGKNGMYYRSVKYTIK